MTATRPPALGPELAGLLADRARSFAFAARFLPREHREAVVVLYAFCRTVDDLADEPPPGLAPADVRARLLTWRAWLGDPTGPTRPEPAALARALGVVIERYDIPRPFLLALLDGVESDLEPVRVADFAELRRYAMRVAGSVGLAMCGVLGASGPAALVAAAELGIAMQLTNILRDVGGDLRRDRVYLPADELARFGYSAERLRADLLAGAEPSADLRALLGFQVARAREYYARSLEGVWYLPPDTRLAILTAGRTYGAILDAIEAGGYDVLRRRAVTSTPRKLAEALGALARTLPRRRRVSPASRTAAGEPPSSAADLAEVLSWLR